MSQSVHAVILAAGLGTRLREVSAGLPKALVRVGDRSILARSLEVLAGAGIRDVTVAAGYEGARVHAEAVRLWPGVSMAWNRTPETTGSMRSLALAWESLERAPGQVLVVEGDLVYGPDALGVLLGAGAPDAVLLSDRTGAGDEVWVEGRGDRITGISKDLDPAEGVLGELVGLSLLSRETVDAMVASHHADGQSAALEHYEERISRLCAKRDIRAVVAHGLVWGEVDDPGHLRRIETEVLPLLEGAPTDP
jgi:2-aminoethylphosphonate-pyruvate transaminase